MVNNLSPIQKPVAAKTFKTEGDTNWGHPLGEFDYGDVSPKMRVKMKKKSVDLYKIKNVSVFILMIMVR